MQRVTAKTLYRLDQKVALLQHLEGGVLFAILPPKGEFRKYGYTFVSENGKFRCLGMTA